MTANPFRRALRTYLMCPGFWIILIVWLIPQFAPLVLLEMTPEMDADGILVMFILPMFFCDLLFGTVIGSTFKRHSDCPRARLLPHFVAAYVAAIRIIAAAAVVIRIIVACSWAGIATSFALGSLALLGIAMGIWMFCATLGGRQALVYLSLLPLAIIAGLFAGSFIGLGTGKPILSPVFGCLGLLLLVNLPKRIHRAFETPPDPLGQQIYPGDVSSSRAVRRRQKQEAEAMQNIPLYGWISDIEFNFVFRGRELRSPWGRLLLRQLIAGFPGITLVLFFCSTVLVGGFTYFLSCQSNPRTRPPDLQDIFFLSHFVMAITLCVAPGAWERAWPGLAMESLRPLSRHDLIRDMCRSSACALAVPAVVHCAGLAAYSILVSLPEPPSVALLPWLVLMIVTYILGYCILLWIDSFRETWATAVGLIAFVVISMPLIHGAVVSDITYRSVYRSPLFLTLVVVGTAVAAVLMYRTAFRRWCHVELG